MKRLLPLTLPILLLVTVGASAVLSGCAGGSYQVRRVEVGNTPCLTAGTVVAVTVVTQTVDYRFGDLGGGGGGTPCLTTTTAVSAMVQTVRDAVGDVRNVAGGSPPSSGLASLGDIKRASLAATQAELIVEVETAAPIPQTAPAGVGSVRYSLVISPYDPASNAAADYTLTAILNDGRWSTAGLMRHGGAADAEPLSLDMQPVLSDHTIHLTVRLADVPELDANFSWGVESSWVKEGTNYSDKIRRVWYTR